MAMLLMADGNHRPIHPKNDRSFSLQELHAYVGGYIEVVAAPPIDGQRTYLVLNEDGKRGPLPFNGFATFLFHMAGGPSTDCIVGDVVMCTRAEMGEDDDVDDAVDPDDR